VSASALYSHPLMHSHTSPHRSAQSQAQPPAPTSALVSSAPFYPPLPPAGSPMPPLPPTSALEDERVAVSSLYSAGKRARVGY
jgi:hypothetical protein